MVLAMIIIMTTTIVNYNCNFVCLDGTFVMASGSLLTVALGFWLAQTARHRNVTYVSVNARSKNMGCFKQVGDYRPPSPNQIVMHFVKTASGQDYARRVMREGATHDPFECAVLSGVS